MIRDITIGQYYQTDSLVHRLDPRTKLAGTMLFLIAVFMNKTIWGYLLAAVFLAIVIHLSHVPFSYMVRGLKAIVIILLFSVCYNLFALGGTPVFHWKFITITKEGIQTSALMAIRLIFLILGSSLMTLTTTPNDLTAGLERSLGFLNRLHIPVHAIAMMMSIALRFIPILIEETDKIMKAQMARGADFDSGNMLAKAKAMIPLLVPLIISAFRRASDLAMAMEARCYHGGEGRTKMHPLKYQKMDRYAYWFLFLFLAGTIAIRVGVQA